MPKSDEFEKPHDTPSSSCHNQPGPGQRFFADRMLQLEISCALEGLAEGLPDTSALRLARALVSVLEPSWTEHTCFQDEALFPILATIHQGSPELSTCLGDFGRDHMEISTTNREVNGQIELLLAGDAPEPRMFASLLRSASDRRRRHIENELVFVETYLPSVLTSAELAILDAWNAARPQPPFPVRLLLEIRH